MSKRRNLLDSAEKRRSLQNVAVARGRLKGALADIVTHSDDDSDSDDSLATRQSKRSKTAAITSSADAIPIPHQSYIMKLFDRSVDLARFDESTPLYPICRAWMQNQPRTNPKSIRAPSPVKREYNPQMAEQYRSGELKEVRAMPKAEVGPVENYPLPVVHDGRQRRTSLDASLDTDTELVPKAALLEEHKKRWGKVRRDWEQYHRAKAERHEASFQLLDALLKTQA